MKYCLSSTVFIVGDDFFAFVLHALFSRAFSSETAIPEMDILAKILKFESSWLRVNLFPSVENFNKFLSSGYFSKQLFGI